MKRNTILSLFILLNLSFLSLSAQLKYYEAEQFPLFGKITEDTETRYERLPQNLKNTTRQSLWDLGKNTAGLSLRFKSNTTSVGLKWTLFQNRNMNHMTATGIKGFDLYCKEQDGWRFVNSARPLPSGFENKATIVANMEEQEREYLLFFPLYDGVVSLEIGIDSLAHIGQPTLGEFQTKKPVVYYGTSILQGGCASRPGMAHANILSRWFDREFINLGFSGNAKLDFEIAELIGKKDASLIILDFMPNVDAKMVKDRVEEFYQIVRRESPDTHILFIENPIFPQMAYDTQMRKAVLDKNEELRRVFKRLKQEGGKNIILISSEGMIGSDDEATVDGIHFTDLGFLRYAEFLDPFLKHFLKD